MLSLTLYNMSQSIVKLVSMHGCEVDERFKELLCTFGKKGVQTRATENIPPENNQRSDWLNGKKNRAARAARTLVQSFDVVCQNDNVKFSKFKV